MSQSLFPLFILRKEVTLLRSIGFAALSVMAAGQCHLLAAPIAECSWKAGMNRDRFIAV